MNKNIEARLGIEQSELDKEDTNKQSGEQMLINKFQDLLNSCEGEFNRDQNEFWELARSKLKNWSEADRDFLLRCAGPAGPDIGIEVTAALAGRKPVPIKKDINKLKL